MTDLNDVGDERGPVVMTAAECRVVGALVEKSFVTPDIYPMTTNAIVSACNQKTAREPVVDYDAVLVDGTLLELRQRALVRRVHTPGSRSTKHRHTLDERLGLEAGELALVAVLLLRGDQTIGELRQRTDRMHEFSSLDRVAETLHGLASRPQALVVQLARQPGQKEARWRHLLADDAEVEVDGQSGTEVADLEHSRGPGTQPGGGLEAESGAMAAGSASPAGVAGSAVETALAPTDDLERRVDELEAVVADLGDRLSRLAEMLGETLD